MGNPDPEVLGIGNPFIDYIFEVNEDQLAELAGTKGGMVPIDYQTFQKILSTLGSPRRVVMGGSGANTIRGLAALGYRCALIGKVGNDEAGNRYLSNLKVQNIKSYLSQTSTPTAQVACLVTEDKERTMRSFLGAALEMHPDEIHSEAFQGVRLVHVEGYTLLYPGVAQKAMQFAKSAGALISFDLGSFEIVHNHKDEIVNLLTHYVDVVFANEEETKALTLLGPEKGCEILKDICPVAVMLLGPRGCILGHGREMMRCPAYPVEPVDTTGAGDLFASGFLHGCLQGKPLEECAHYGAIVGAAVVQMHGVEMPQEVWDSIKKRMKDKG